MPPETECIRKNKSVYKSIVCQPITWLLILGLFANTWVSQAVTVDMSVYANCFFEKGKTGTLMLIISVITAVSSVLGGRGYWSAAWNTCALSSLLSFCAGIVIAVKTVSIRQTDNKEKRVSKKNQSQKKNRVSAHG